MARFPPVSGPRPVPGPSGASPSNAAQRLCDDPVLRIAFLAAGLLVTYQLVVTLLQPAWFGLATDWLQALLAWSALLVVVLVSRWFTPNQRRLALSWWLVSAGLLSYALARILWLVLDQFLFPHHTPLPNVSDLFFLLQYPFYLLALLLVPRVSHRIVRVLVALDACLLIGAALALSWYFLLAPIYLSSNESPLGKLVNLGYLLGDLAVLFGLTVILLRYHEYGTEGAAVVLLIAAIVCLVVADTWNAILLLNTSTYRTGSPPDLFWLAFYLLVPLAGLVRFRIAQRAPAGVSARLMSEQPTNLRRQDLKASIRLTLPIAAALLVSVVLLSRAELGIKNVLPSPVPLLIALGLLGLAVVRQGLMAMENERVRREREAARAREQAMREINQQMELFLGIASHELKTPLTSILLGLQWIHRRVQQVRRELSEGRHDIAPQVESMQTLAETTLQQGGRLQRLVQELLDTSRVQAGQFELHRQPVDLVGIVQCVVEEQRLAAPERTLLLHEDVGGPALVSADAERIGQVVTNYLSNALRYSGEAKPVEVGVQVEGGKGRVWVRDQGPGIPWGEQERLWERFRRVPGIEVQSGSGMGLGIGLYLSKMIITQHGGQVGVQSTSGAGATFWFTLPLVSPDEDHRLEAPQEGGPGK